MATGDGIATLLFGSSADLPDQVSDALVVTGQTGLAADDHIEAWIMGTDATTGGASAWMDNNAYQHMIAPIRVTVSSITAGTGFTLIGISDWSLSGNYCVRWVWSTRTPVP